MQLLPGYYLRPGSGLDRAMLVKFMQLTYQELFPEQDFSHLQKTVAQYFSQETPLWWVEFLGEGRGESLSILPKSPLLHVPPSSSLPPKVAGVWVGNAVDQVWGDRHAHIFLLYVVPEHRRRGIGKALMRYVENWARVRGDRQLGLQVFKSNQPALNLYHQLGYQTHSLWMAKKLTSEE